MSTALKRGKLIGVIYLLFICFLSFIIGVPILLLSLVYGLSSGVLAWFQQLYSNVSAVIEQEQD